MTMMNPSTAQASVIVDELARCGVQEAVLSPGSRSTPLALALVRSDIRTHVRIDERSAAFVALGLAKASGLPVAVVCTSGTAAANFYPAIVEADICAVPLIVLTADRPPELRETGASQTIDQIKMFGSSVRWFCEVGVTEQRPGSVAYWRSVISRAVAAAQGPAGGPVHLNVAFRKPLEPNDSSEWVESLTGREGGGPWTRVVRSGVERVRLEAPTHGVVVVGEGAYRPDDAVRFAELAGWPVVAEPNSGARNGPNVITAATYLLGVEEFAARHRPDTVITVGKPTVSSAVLELCSAARRHIIVDPGARWADPRRTASLVISGLGEPRSSTVDADWLASWRTGNDIAEQTIRAMPALAGDEITELGVAQRLSDELPADALLFVGSSMPIRDLDLVMPARELRVLCNRGAAGIDGVVSSAVGAALAHQRTGGGAAWALIGDLTAIHDHNGLIIGPREPTPDLTFVVVNNDGGGIFSLLPQASGDAAEFERVFGTPHGVSMAELASSAGIAVAAPASLSDFVKLIHDPWQGLRLIEFRTQRDHNAALHKEIRRAIHAAVSAWISTT